MHSAIKKNSILFSCVSSALLVTAVLLFIYAYKGIYPFGFGSVAYWDMNQSVIPSYYHTWDVLHGDKALLWDWYSGLGGSMSDRAGNYILNPINLVFLFIKRDHIVEFMSVFLLIKLILSSVSMSLYISKKNNELPIWVRVICSISYASCGFVLQYYCFISFLDIVMIFPLVVLSLDTLVYKGRTAYFVSLMTLGFVTNIQLMYMVCIYLIVRVYLDIWDKPKEDKIHIVSVVGISTAIALLISAWSWLPMLIQLVSSQRAGLNMYSEGYLGTLMNSVCDWPEQKLFMLYGSESVLAVYAIILLERKQLKHYRKKLILILMMLIPIFIEGVNILWHPGGYVCFPMRFGYMLSFESIPLIVDFLNSKRASETESISVYNRLAGYAAITVLPLFLVILFVFDEGFLPCASLDSDAYNSYWLIITFIVFITFMSIISKNLKVAIFVCTVIILAQSVLGMYGFVGPDYSTAECDIDLLYNAVSVENENDKDEDLAVRYKNEDSSLITNWPFIARVPAIENWTWGTNPNIRKNMEQLGYSYNYTRFVDNGGTIFTDNLLGVQKLISAEKPNERLYTFYKSGENADYYDYNYTLPFGIVTQESLSQEYTEDYFENQNILFSEITGCESKLIEEYDIGDLIIDEPHETDEEVSVGITVDGYKTIYLYSANGDYVYSFKVNAEDKMIPFLMYVDNSTYPAFFRNGLIECGTYSDETVNMVLYIRDVYGKGEEGWKEDLRIGALDMHLLETEYKAIENRQKLEVRFRKSGLSIYGNVEEDGNLFLPIGYNKGWNVKLNGKKTDAFAGVQESFLTIPIKRGNVSIDIDYSAPGLAVGAFGTLLGIMIAVVYRALMKKDRYSSCLESVLYIIFLTLCFSILVFMYFIPVFLWLTRDVLKVI